MGGPERGTQILEFRRVLRTTNVGEQGPEVDNEGENSNRRRESWIRSERMTLRDSRAAAVRLDQRRLIRNGVPPGRFLPISVAGQRGNCGVEQRLTAEYSILSSVHGAFVDRSVQ
jgi:hypothetical protein